MLTSLEFFLKKKKGDGKPSLGPKNQLAFNWIELKLILNYNMLGTLYDDKLNL